MAQGHVLRLIPKLATLGLKAHSRQQVDLTL